MKMDPIACAWVKPGRFGSFFVLCFLEHFEDTVSRCFVYQDSGHRQTPRISHIFVLSLLVLRGTLPRNAYFSWQTLNCQIVPVLPSYIEPLVDKQIETGNIAYEPQYDTHELQTVHTLTPPKRWGEELSPDFVDTWRPITFGSLGKRKARVWAHVLSHAVYVVTHSILFKITTLRCGCITPLAQKLIKV